MRKTITARTRICLVPLAAILGFFLFKVTPLLPDDNTLEPGERKVIRLHGGYSETLKVRVAPIVCGDQVVSNWCFVEPHCGYIMSRGTGTYQKWAVNPITGSKIHKVGEPFQGAIVESEPDKIFVHATFSDALWGKRGVIEVTRSEKGTEEHTEIRVRLGTHCGIVWLLLSFIVGLLWITLLMILAAIVGPRVWGFLTLKWLLRGTELRAR